MQHSLSGEFVLGPTVPAYLSAAGGQNRALIQRKRHVERSQSNSFSPDVYRPVCNGLGGDMTWNPKQQLVKRAAEIAKTKHPEGFNKAQLIAASEEVFGGFASNPHKSIKTLEDVNDAGNAMAQIDGNYPVGMSGCFIVGINGGCGYECPVFLNGQCYEHQQDMLETLFTEPELDGDEIAEIFETLGEDINEFKAEMVETGKLVEVTS